MLRELSPNTRSVEAAKAAASPTPHHTDPPTHKWLIAIAVMLGTTLEVLDVTIVNVSLPHMQGTFSASVDEIAWVVTSYLVANGIMIPMTGWISSRFGRKRYFLFSMMIFVRDLGALWMGRVAGTDGGVSLLQGAAGAAMIPLSQAILMETFPPEEQALAMATWGVGLMLAPIIGPTLGGWITDNWSWRWNFYINIPVGLLAALMVYVFVHDPSYLRARRDQGGRVDYAGIILLILGLGLLQIVLDRGQRSDWFNSGWVVWCSLGAGVSLIALTIHELRFSAPIIDLHIMKNRVFALAVFLVVAMSSVLYGTGLLNPVFLQNFMGYTAWKAGLVMSPRGLGALASMITVGQVARFGYDTRRLIGVGFAMMACGLWMMAHWDLQVGIWQVIMPTIVLGIGLGLVFPTLSAATLACVERERMGYAASLYNMMRNTGAAIGIWFMTTKLISHEQIHQSNLVEHFSVFEAWKLGQTGVMPGAPHFNYTEQIVTGQHQSLGMVYGMVQSQAAMLSFNDIYRTLAVLTFVLIPGFMLLKGTGRPAPPGAH